MSQPTLAASVVIWPSAPLTDTLVRKALISLDDTLVLLSTTDRTRPKLVQWSTYDAIDHDLTHASQNTVLSSSYVIRKALIRKHFLARCIHGYVVKHAESVLLIAVPRTWDFEISFADELDDMWADELYELGQEMDGARVGATGGWWILKPGMADRGMGIRLFSSRESLQRIFEEFEDDSDGEEERSDDDSRVVMSQLRHFVIQEYVPTPLLLDPYEVPLNGAPTRPFSELKGHKFHLRAYCVASGALKVYLYTRILALFSSKSYAPPDSEAAVTIDLAPHLTNTSLQAHRGEEGVRLLDELVGCHILSSRAAPQVQLLSEDDLQQIQDQMAEVLQETFRAAANSPIHFQPLPNAFELYGIDFLVSHEVLSTSPTSRFQVKLLEVNAEPAIELTGPRLTWILQDLFQSIAKVCVGPFLQPAVQEGWPMGETRHHMRKCLDLKLRAGGH
ncbi:TTL-domain-containing protein [Auriscalpium vulgare]|uniref:TTL-domain-containing protein n=1 Tax=Auriscalpium vulgare TaxID=40419 RepID=A0ACB8SBP1_9AGAM|nr:TTL-domain-containing protein [Auriscalpium vulgare]